MHFSLLPFDPYHKDAKRRSKSKICKVVRAEEEEGGGGGGEREKRKGLQIGIESIEERRYKYGVSVLFCVCICDISVWLALGTCECDMLVVILGCACEWMSVHLCVCWVVQDGVTPAYIASYKGELKCLEVLIAAGADVNKAEKVHGGCISPYSLLIPTTKMPREGAKVNYAK